MGHILRHESLLKSIIERDVNGHIGRRRPRVRVHDLGNKRYD